ncbi:hypothetical protein CANARDRAFT_27451 [[Candida] arabinofermentans NRRL YB-2248]|uniref:Major facilitator superfamily (MFS) profile domain-containing protein n=1 Tax=[Candida] arabinofermentans NRRL YB-2248 TaxID=983967 RepID=A0A1E4T392_9ASCO|nr:hypothetical protein CANARDRAFT_27451 [[Candida] arabinofermentans NRRL YB-2248]
MSSQFDSSSTIHANSLKRHDKQSISVNSSTSTSPFLHTDDPTQQLNHTNNSHNLTPYANRHTNKEVDMNENSIDSGKLVNGGGTGGDGNLPISDRPRFFLLVLLYLIQGVPIGLAFGSIPFLLKSGDLSYSQVGIFTLASYPYSLKLLWSPIVDSLFLKKLGRRRSWILPVQCISGLTLLYLGTKIDSLLNDLEFNLYNLTYTFFFLILLCATQDIAVDGWALTILSQKALSYASTAQTIGLNTGYFLSFTVFLAFNSPDFANSYLRSIPSEDGLITLGQYMSFWGWIYLIVTLLIFMFVPEDPLNYEKKEDVIELDDLSIRDNETGVLHTRKSALFDVYYKMWNVVKLKNVKLFIIIHLISKIAFQANEAATNLKLLDKGFSREDLAITVLIDFPFEIIFGYYSARWSTGSQPLKPWMYAYLGRILAAAIGQLLVYCFPKSGKINMTYFLFVIFQHLLGSFMSTVQFVSICAFHTQIADPSIGGTYMTTLNTLSNLGGQWPKIIVLNMIDNFTKAECIDPTNEKSFKLQPFHNCYSSNLKNQCIDAGGECNLISDGYYSTNILCIIIGLVLYYGWIKKTVIHLQSLPIGAWRVGKPTALPV